MKSRLYIRAFTLIELLVVISIISLLSSVVLASVTNAEARGRDGRRTEDLVQFRNALELFGSDNNGRYPAVTGSITSGGPTITAYTSKSATTSSNPLTCGTGNDWTSANDASSQQFASYMLPYISQLPKDPVNDSTHCYIYTASQPVLISGNGDSVAGTAVMYTTIPETFPNPGYNPIGIVEGDPTNYMANTDAPQLAQIIGVNGSPTLASPVQTVTITGLSANRVYNATTVATITGTPTLVGVAPGDQVSVTGTPSGSFPDKDVGVGKIIMVSGLSLTGRDAAKYSLAQPVQLAATITPFPLTATLTSSSYSKTYDGVATYVGFVTSTHTPSVFAGDRLVFATSNATFDTKNAGTGKVFTATIQFGALPGTNAADYSINSTATASGTIIPLAITVTAQPNTKAFDGTTSAAAVPSVSPSIAAGDAANFTESYSTASAGSGKTLTPSGTVNDGNGGNNYTTTFVPQNTGVIN